MEVFILSKTLEEILVTMLGLSLYTQGLTPRRVHTKDTKWKESTFYANKLPRKRTTLSTYNGKGLSPS